MAKESLHCKLRVFCSICYMFVCLLIVVYRCLQCRLVQSEYDEYREKYRLFDSALFCMPPEHKLRRVCHKILTYQCAAPEGSLFSRKSLTLTQFGKRLSYALRLVIFS